MKKPSSSQQFEAGGASQDGGPTQQSMRSSGATKQGALMEAVIDFHVVVETCDSKTPVERDMNETCNGIQD